MDCRMNVGIAWQEGDGEQVALHARKVATPTFFGWNTANLTGVSLDRKSVV